MTSPGSSGVEPGAARFFGWLLIVMGGLITLLCGGCTLLMVGVGFAGMTSQPGALMGWMLMVGMFGGLPTAAGIALVWVGWLLVRKPRQTPKKVGETFD
jgi:hypothetical protein